MKLLKFIPIGIVALVLAFTSCNKTKEATDIKLNETTLSLDDANPAVELIATLTPSDATGDIVWKSSNNNAVTVVSSGKRTAIVTGVDSGVATITATINGLVAECAVTSTVTPEVVGEAPPELDPPTNGMVTIAIRTPNDVQCYGFIMVGIGVGPSDWSHTPDASNTFVRVEGTETWWTLDVPANFQGKPCALKEDGTSSWDYQWSRNGGPDGDNVMVLPQTTGSYDFELENSNPEEGGQPKLIGLEENTIVFIHVKKWDLNSCAAAIPGGNGTFTVTITEGYVEGSDIILAGNFETSPWGESTRTMTPGSEPNTWTWTGDYPENFAFKVIMMVAGTQIWSEGSNHIFDGTDYTASFYFVEVNTDPVIPEDQVISLIGQAVGGWDDTNDINLTYVSTTNDISVYTATNVTFAEGTGTDPFQFKFRLNHAWDKNWGYNAANITTGGDNFEDANGNFKIITPKTYASVSFKIDWETGTWTVDFVE